jgi:hypothetical protein
MSLNLKKSRPSRLVVFAVTACQYAVVHLY